jgi:hypothetical protein
MRPEPTVRGTKLQIPGGRPRLELPVARDRLVLVLGWAMRTHNPMHGSGL